MNPEIRKVLWVLAGCFVLLFAQLNRIQVVQAESLREHPANTRNIQRTFNQQRGDIVTSDGTVVATSTPLDDSVFIEQREYPEGSLYAHTVGYLSFNVGASGVEEFFSDELVGTSNSLIPIPNEETKQDVVLTLDHRVQSAAQAALGDRNGSVVALNPQTGGILAFWSFPSFDPTPIASHSGVESTEAFSDLSEADSNPLLAKTYQELYFPGSTFKVVTAASALDTGVATATEPSFEELSEYELPLSTATLGNSGGGSCGGTLTNLLVVSCNTGFAQLAVEELGPEAMVISTEKFGFNQEIPFDLRTPAASVFPTDYGALITPGDEETPAGIFENSAKLAQTAIGQNDVSATPLQMALVAAAVANDGEVPTPHVVGEVRTPEGVDDNGEPTGGETVTELTPDVFGQAMKPSSAEALSEAMVATVEEGTAQNAAISGLRIGAKTGSAQVGTDPPQTHAWTIAFAGDDNQPPELAIAVLVEANSNQPDQSGGADAAPVARAVIQAYFG